MQWITVGVFGSLFATGIWLVLHYPGEEIMWTGLSISIAASFTAFVKLSDVHNFTMVLIFSVLIVLGVIFADKHQAVLLWLILTSAILLITLRRKGLLEGFGTLMRNYKTELTCGAITAFGAILLSEMLVFGGYPDLQKILGWLILFLVAILLIIIPFFAFLIKRIQS